jgi:hypothetical protein
VNTKNIYLFIFILICGLIPISSFSLWADEAWTLTEYGLQPNLASLFTSLSQSGGGDAQFPGYNLYIWGWIKIFGATEYSARIANLPLYFSAVLYCFLYLPRSCKFKIGFIALICLSPLAWFYLNEARYIISVFSFSMFSFVSVISYFEGDEKNKKLNTYVFFSSIVLGSAFMMLYAFYLILLAGLVYYYIREKKGNLQQLITQWKVPGIISFILLILIGCYYLYTLLNGMGGTRLNPSFKNIVFLLYEFLGFGGIGPSRDVLRESNLIDIHSIYFLLVMLFAFVYFVLVALFLINFKTVKDKLSFYGIFILIITFLIFYVFAESFQFKFLSRHLIFLYVPFTFFIYTIFYNCIKKSPRLGLFIIIAYSSGILYSNYNIRFNPEYKKTNMVNAFNIVNKESKGLKVIWTEERDGFEYYAVYKKMLRTYDKNKFIFLLNKQGDDLVKSISEYMNEERFLILIANKKDYKNEIKNFLISKYYKIIYTDKDYTIYR